MLINLKVILFFKIVRKFINIGFIDFFLCFCCIYCLLVPRNIPKDILQLLPSLNVGVIGTFRYDVGKFGEHLTQSFDNPRHCILIGIRSQLVIYLLKFILGLYPFCLGLSQLVVCLLKGCIGTVVGSHKGCSYPCDQCGDNAYDIAHRYLHCCASRNSSSRCSLESCDEVSNPFRQ